MCKKLELFCRVLRLMRSSGEHVASAQENDLPVEVTMKCYPTGDCSPAKGIVRSIQADLVLACGICHAPTVAIKLGEKDNIVWINSAVRSFPLIFASAKHLSLFLDDLKAGRYRKAHQRLRSICDGLDYYCPDCDIIYCDDHYDILPVFDKDFPGFYDYSLARCPKGHERIMDD